MLVARAGGAWPVDFPLAHEGKPAILDGWPVPASAGIRGEHGVIVDKNPDVVALRARTARFRAEAEASRLVLKAHCAKYPADPLAGLMSAGADLAMAGAVLGGMALEAGETARRVAECRQAAAASLAAIARENREIDAKFAADPPLAALLRKETAELEIAEITRSAVCLVLWAEAHSEHAWQQASVQLAELAASAALARP
jgi:hypothetical protein